MTEISNPPGVDRRLALAGLALAPLSSGLLAMPTEYTTMPATDHPLIANRAHPSLGGHADTFGRIIGSWEGEFREIGGEKEQHGKMEVHLYWVLDGRAVQDVWITPSRQEVAQKALSPLYYGSTMRIFDPAITGWRMFWFNPVEPYVRGELVGHRVGDDIVQLGNIGDTPIKWVFENITPSSFEWRGYWLGPNGGEWKLSTEFKVRRI